MIAAAVVLWLCWLADAAPLLSFRDTESESATGMSTGVPGEGRRTQMERAQNDILVLFSRSLCSA